MGVKECVLDVCACGTSHVGYCSRETEINQLKCVHHEDLYVMRGSFTSSHKHSPAAVINVIVLQITRKQTVSQHSNSQCQVQRETQ